MTAQERVKDTHGPHPKVVITLPAYRAQDTLERTVADIPDSVADQVILVDDASPDDTVAVARNLGIDVYVHSQNRGYGGNQKTCYVRALSGGADIVVLLHPDYQYDPTAVPLLIAPLLAGRADMTFGSRFAGISDPRAGGMPLYRFVGNRITTVLENVMLGSRFTELHSGLRAYTRQCLLSLPFLRYTDDFAFDSQMLVDAITSGQRVVEVPIPTRYSQESSSISIRRSLKYVGLTLAYCGRQSAVRGRRAKRPAKRDRHFRPAERRRLSRPCVLCGSLEQELLYPSNASAEASPAEFSCTSGTLAVHDDIARCMRCGMVSSVPTLTPQEIARTYEGVVDASYLAEEDGRRNLFAWLLRMMDGYVVPGRRLFEIGSNVGLFLDMANRLGWDARGIEPSRWAVEVGRERFAVDLRRQTVEEIDEPAGSADAIVLLDVLEHLVEPLEALRRIRAVLNGEGLLVLSTIDFASPHARIRGGAWPWMIRPHLHYFTPRTLAAMLEKAGFGVVEWARMPRSFHLSYVAERAASSHRTAGRLAGGAATVFDPKLPFGWLGDIILVLARPRPVEPPDTRALSTIPAVFNSEAMAPHGAGARGVN